MEYRKQNNTYFACPKDNDKDRIEVEVGDSKQPDFYPQLKIKRWDNECNCSIRLKTDIPQKPVKSGKYIKTSNTRFYELDDGYEFEVILDRKPKSNVIEFTLQDKDVEYFYQPPLTQEEIDKGAVRPENVVGSYAVYTKSNKINYVGGKEYKAGKVGHIYRPKIIDAKGNEVWGKLHIENGILSVTIPQKFLDKAVYPVKIDPTFGYTSPGSSWQAVDYLRGSKFTSPSDLSSVTDITSYVKFISGGPPSDTMKMGIWSSSGSYISNSETDDITIDSTTPSWKGFNYTTAPSLSASTDYFLCLGSTGFTFESVAYDTGSTNQGVCDTASTFFSTDNFSGYETYDTNKYSIYVTYTATAGDKTVTPSAQTLALTLKSPTITAEQNKSVSPSAQNINATLNTPIVTATRNVTVTPSTLTLTASINEPAEKTDDTYSPAVQSLALTLGEPIVNTEQNITVQPATIDLTLSQNIYNILLGTGAEAQNLALTLNQPNVTAEQNKTEEPNAIAANLTLNEPNITVEQSRTVTPSTLTLTATLNPTSEKIDSTETPEAQSLSLSLEIPTVAAEQNKTVSPEPAGIAAGINEPSISFATNATITPASLSLTATCNAPTPKAWRMNKILIDTNLIVRYSKGKIVEKSG